ncbi:MAG TPA: YidC/Oxa1 family insertase periplasmic-domain containing protein, partial [Luteolibacter sp.]|nr:YidC/Oxa1 family insertase periplasmic-domain containing protein [Luteolibacter sp.]
FTFTNIGGGIKEARFKDQFQVGSKTANVVISGGAAPIGGFASRDGEDLTNIPYFYKADQSIPGKQVVYIAKLPSGLIVKKTFKVIDPAQPGAPYLLDYDLQFDNQATGALALQEWSLFLGEASPLYQNESPAQIGYFWRDEDKMHFQAVSKFHGNMISSGKPLLMSDDKEKITFGGVSNQFFTTVLRAKDPVVGQLWARESKVNLKKDSRALSSVRAGLILPKATLNPTEQKTLSYRFFIGPKDNTMLRKMDNVKDGHGWGDVMQYGFFTGPVSRVLNFILNHLHTALDGVAKNWAWGLSIIFLTIIVRGAIWPLHAKSTRTMKRMSKLQPEMAKLKEKYPDDPNKLNTEMMGLYRKYGINPLGGCLPMLIQIPIFFGFFTMLQYAVEFRAQGFLWIKDLSQPDTLFTIDLPFELPFLGAHLPINILPIFMGLTSFAQIAMTPKTGDKMQQRIMLMMPIMFFVFCYNYASALALYWTTQNIFSIIQTWLMNKIPEPELKARPDGPGGAGKKSWVQRMAERQAELQKAREQGGHGGSGGGNMRDVTPKKPRGPRTGG